MKADNFAGEEKPLEFITFSKKDGNPQPKNCHIILMSRFPGLIRGKSATPINWQRASRRDCGRWKVPDRQVIPVKQDPSRVGTK